MIKKTISIINIVVLSTIIFFSTIVFASEQINITPIDTKKAGDNVIISGNTNLEQVTVVVRRENNTILYIDVVNTTGGKFESQFTLPKESKNGNYKVEVGEGNINEFSSFIVDETAVEPEPEKVDKTKLIEVINKAKTYKESEFTKDSWSILKATLSEAEIIYSDEKSTQASVDEIIKKLQYAIDELKKSPTDNGSSGGDNNSSGGNNNSSGENNNSDYESNSSYDESSSSDSSTNDNKTKPDKKADSESAFEIKDKINNSDKSIDLKYNSISISIPNEFIRNTISEKDIENSKSIKFVVDEIKQLTNDELMKNFVDKPIISIKLMLDNKEIPWNNSKIPVTIFIDYKPNDLEINNIENITVWGIDGNNTYAIYNAKYDEATGKISFSAYKSGIYAVTFVNKTFEDTSSYEWAEKSINILASKGIISGSSKTEFSPQNNVTRADYLVLLIKALGLNDDTKESFKDVSENTYYYNEVSIAKSLGIIVGREDNNFYPTESITRQDMMVMTDRALKVAKFSQEYDTSKSLENFKDMKNVADYAKESVTSLVQMGLINGYDNKINALDNTNRAEAATIIYNIYKNIKL